MSGKIIERIPYNLKKKIDIPLSKLYFTHAYYFTIVLLTASRFWIDLCLKNSTHFRGPQFIVKCSKYQNKVRAEFCSIPLNILQNEVVYVIYTIGGT